MNIHTIERRIYYEHTDGGGVVYYANYLKFLEQARTETLRDYGFNHQDLITQFNLIFVVRKIEVDYLAPVKLDDKILIQSYINEIGRASLHFNQKIFNQENDDTILEAKVKIACINQEFKLIKLPKMLRIVL